MRETTLPLNRPIPATKADGRTVTARRYRAILKSLTAELGGDPTAGQLALVRSAAAATVASEQLQAKVLDGVATPDDVSEIGRLANVQARCLIAVGLNRRAKRGEAKPALERYLDEGKA